MDVILNQIINKKKKTGVSLRNRGSRSFPIKPEVLRIC